MVKNFIPAMRDIDEALYEVSEELAIEELGNRRRRVWYREKAFRVGIDLSLGDPGDNAASWVEILPKPVTVDNKREYSMDPIGVILKGDLELRVDRLAISREILAKAEFFISDDPDSLGPQSSDDANYDLLGGQVLEGGGGIRARFRSNWLCYVRLRQLNG